jgi:drug/metabolite transporter (DMT)-like permease
MKEGGMQNKRITQKTLGFIFIIISAISFGAMPIFARLAYEAKADPITVLFLRFGIAALVMFVILFASKTAFPRGLLLLELILLGAIAYVGALILAAVIILSRNEMRRSKQIRTQ